MLTKPDLPYRPHPDAGFGRGVRNGLMITAFVAAVVVVLVVLL